MFFLPVVVEISLLNTGTTRQISVDISYKGKLYRLKRFGHRVSTPFEYRFESDGDLDITVAGKTYDIDSPYDIDSSKTAKKKKKNSTRTSTKAKRK